MNIPLHSPADPKARTRDAVIKTFAVIGLVVVLVAAGWVGIRAAQHAPGALSAVLSAFDNVNLGGTDSSVSVRVTPTVATSTSDVTITWEHNEKKADGAYTLRFDCRDELTLEYVTDDTTQTVFCNIPFNFVNVDNTLTIRPTLETPSRAETTLYIDFTPNGESEVSETGSAPLIVLNEKSNATVGPQQPGGVAGTSVTVVTPSQGPRQTQTFNFGTTTIPAGVSDPNGTPDLVIRILDTGIANRNGDFTRKDPVDEDDQVAIQFEVRNDGTKSTGEWRFEATLPTRPNRTFRSPKQASLLPGERIEYVISFDRVEREDEVTVRIEVDDSDDIDESNENNNRDSVDIEVDH